LSNSLVQKIIIDEMEDRCRDLGKMR